MSDQRGFTLVETLVAFAILAVVLVAFYGAIGTGFRNFDSAARVEEAVLIGQSQLDRVVALRRLPDQLQGSVIETPYHWHIEILVGQDTENQQPQTSPVRAVTVRLAVNWQGPAGVRGVSIDRLLLVPQQQGVQP